jgi:hypothetical protein
MAPRPWARGDGRNRLSLESAMPEHSNDVPRLEGFSLGPIHPGDGIVARRPPRMLDLGAAVLP